MWKWFARIKAGDFKLEDHERIKNSNRRKTFKTSESEERRVSSGQHAASYSPHSPYSPDIAPSDFHLFIPLHNSLNGKNFNCLADIKNYI